MSNKKLQIDRRNFLRCSGLSALGVLSAGGLSLVPGLRAFAEGDASAEIETVPASSDTLIFVFMRGSFEALAWFPPLAGTALRTKYDEYRPNVKFDAQTLVAGSPFGVNSRLTPIRRLIQQNDMSVVYGLGSINGTMSHFNQMDIIEGGNSVRREQEGLFQRVANKLGWNSPLDLMAVESTVPRALAGSHFVYQYSGLNSLGQPGVVGVLPGLNKTERLQRNFGDSDRMQALASKMATVNQNLLTTLTPITAPATPLPEFSEIIRVLKGGFNPKVMSVSIGGWDFHDNLVSRMTGDGSVGAGLAGKLGVSLEILAQQLKAMGKWQNTTVVVMGEFGRRIVENGAHGTDHGRGGAALVMGGKVNGGRVVAKTDLASRLHGLYTISTRAQSNIPVDYDYRILLEEIFRKRFGLSSVDAQNLVFKENISGINTLNLIRTV
jgi:uncharacterized protein (DUF1501 family)